jgi:serine/threonine protein phosphatase PrpC
LSDQTVNASIRRCATKGIFCHLPDSNEGPAEEEDSSAWPAAVLGLLEPVDAVAARRGSLADWATGGGNRNNLRMVAGAYCIPHPEKAHSGGADSFYIHDGGLSLGVADGVGEWEWRFKCSPRAFADELMAGCKDAIADTTRDLNFDPQKGAKQLLQCGYDAAIPSRSFGSSTALVTALSGSTGILGVANLGDSAMMQLRRQSNGRLAGMRFVGCTREQQHSFNCPYQLACMPTEADFPRLLAEGKSALVTAVKRSRHVRQDVPEDADGYALNLEEGDLLVLGTDGLFDNLHQHEIQELASQAISPHEASERFELRDHMLASTAANDSASTAPGRLAEALARAALHRSLDVKGRSPFSVNAQKAGLHHVGGKMDDITVVCAWVVGLRGDVS